VEYKKREREKGADKQSEEKVERQQEKCRTEERRDKKEWQVFTPDFV